MYFKETVDVWAIGCIVYNMILGVPPYYSSNLEDLREKLLYNDVRADFVEEKVLKNYSSDLTDFLNKTLELDPSKRITV